MQWLIDIIKEWVLAKVYATEAWVTEWFTPYSVTGHLNPNATCLYFKAGTHNNKPYYRRSDGEWFIWWDPPLSWVISQTVGSLVPVSWFRVDPNIEGPYLEGVAGIGTATVSLGYRSLCTGFVNRGDPAAYDFVVGDFIKNGAWHELDLSAIVPAGAKAVEIQVDPLAPGVATKFRARRHGNANAIAVAKVFIIVAMVLDSRSFTVAVDNDRKIDYWMSNVVWLGLNFVVKGWYF